MGKAEGKSEKTFWQTLPGIITSIAALITALGGCVAVVFGIPAISNAVFGITPTPVISQSGSAYTQTPYPTYTPFSTSALPGISTTAISNANDVSATPHKQRIEDLGAGDVWFIKSSQSISGYVPEPISQPDGDDFERLISYFRLYRHPSDCKSKNIRGVALQVILFKSDSGSKTYYANAYASAKKINASITYAIGETGFFRKNSQADDHCSNEISDRYSIVFQRFNVIGIVSTWIVPDSMRESDVQEWLIQIAAGLDDTLTENSK